MILIAYLIWLFPKIEVPQNGWLMENPIKMDDFGVPFLFGNTHISPENTKVPITTFTVPTIQAGMFPTDLDAQQLEHISTVLATKTTRTIDAVSLVSKRAQSQQNQVEKGYKWKGWKSIGLQNSSMAH